MPNACVRAREAAEREMTGATVTIAEIRQLAQTFSRKNYLINVPKRQHLGTISGTAIASAYGGLSGASEKLQLTRITALTGQQAAIVAEQQ